MAAAGRLLLAAALAAAVGSHAKDVLPESGPLGPGTVGRLLLIDAVNLGSRVVAVGARGWIAYTDDNGQQWIRAKSPAAPLLTAVHFNDPRTGWAVGHDSMILATTDGGATWLQQFSAPAEQRPLMDVLFTDASTGFAVGAYGAYYETADGGRTWTARKIHDEDKHYNAILRIRDGQLLILGEAGAIFHSADAGRTWQPIASPYKGSLFGGVVADDGSVVAFGLRGRIYRSTDGGRSWKQVDNKSQASLMGGTKLPDGAIVVAGAGGTVLVSRDNGQSFVPVETGNTRILSTAVLGAPDALLLLGDGGPRPVSLPSGPRK